MHVEETGVQPEILAAIPYRAGNAMNRRKTPGCPVGFRLMAGIVLNMDLYTINLTSQRDIPDHRTKLPSATMNKLPVSIVSPVRNCIAQMPAHAEHLRELARIAGELIIVDSDSSDGTMEYLRENLRECGAVFLNHPPGLYPSWNHGLSHATFPFVNVATVGDTLPPDSLVKLHSDLERTSCDVVISAPILLNPDGSRSRCKWPIHQLIEYCGLTVPQTINQATWLALSLGFFPKSPLASCAGNLFRTAVFSGNPFPTDCGHRSDVIWGITSSRKIRWMVDPTVESYYKFHPPAKHRQRPSATVIAEWQRVALGALDEESEFLRREGIPEWFLSELGGFVQDACDAQAVDAEYRHVRRHPLPWFFNPRAIRLRKQRQLLKLKNIAKYELLARFMKSINTAGTELV